MIPAIYHLEDKVIILGVGRSAVVTSVYMNCSKTTYGYNGEKHDYSKQINNKSLEKRKNGAAVIVNFI